MNVDSKTLASTQASHWYARLHAPDCNVADRQAFQRWLAADPLHAQAYAATVRTAELITRQATLDQRIRKLADAALKNSVADPGSAPQHGVLIKNWRRAAVLLVGGGLAALLTLQFNEPAAPLTPMASYANDERHEQRIALNDGSIIHLDTDSAVTVVMSAQARRLELIKGRAYFEVAHDRSRPFSVIAAGTRTVALGTRFEVSLLSQTVNVTLAEGSVAVSEADAADHAAADAWREVLTPGQQLQIDMNTEQRNKRPVNSEAITSWSKGRLVFDGTPLAAALDEINRYASVKVKLGDAGLANIPIGGNFVAGSDSNEFVDTLTAVLPLRSVRAGANEIVLFQRYANADR